MRRAPEGLGAVAVPVLLAILVVAAFVPPGDSGSPSHSGQSAAWLAKPSPPHPDPKRDPLTVFMTVTRSQPEVGQPVTFSSQTSGGVPPYHFLWSFGDFGVATGQVATHTYTSPGTYQVTLTVTDFQFEFTTSTEFLNVTMPSRTELKANFTIQPSSPISRQPVAFNAIANGGSPPYTFDWSYGDGTVATSTSPVSTHTYPQPRSYTPTLTVTDSAGQMVEISHTLTIAVPPPPPPKPAQLKVDFTLTPQPATGGQSIAFAAQVTGGTSPYTFVWDMTGGIIKNGQTVNWSFNQSGNYSVTVTVTDSKGNLATKTHTVTVQQVQPPPPTTILSINITTTPSTQTVGRNIIFHSVVKGGVAPYREVWYYGDGTTENGTSTLHSYMQAGVYTVTLKVSDINDDTGAASVVVTIQGPTTTQTGNSQNQQPPESVLPDFLSGANALIAGLTVVALVVLGMSAMMKMGLMGRRHQSPVRRQV